MSYMTIKDASKLWRISERRISKLCNENRIEGAIKFGWSWAIPRNTEKPLDRRCKKSKIITSNKEIPCEDLAIVRKWAMPNKNTFKIKPIHELIQSELSSGLWIDPFANDNKLATITNDLNPVFNTDYHLDALDFLKLFENESVDGVLYDPPYSPRQVSECYNDVGYNVTWNTTKASFWSNHKKEIARILKKGGKVITFGWNSGGIGKTYGFKKTKILLVPHGGWHNDTICTVEIKQENIYYEETKTMRQVSKNNENDLELINWVNNFPDNFWDFRKNDTKELTHGFHTYPATMIYPISRNIIKKMKELYNINTLFDPFSGSGTVPVEGVIANIPHIYATDLNPLSLLLTKVKTTPVSSKDLMYWQDFVKAEIESKLHEMSNIFFELDNYIEKQGLDIYDKGGWGSEASIILETFLKEKKIAFTVPNFTNMGYWFKPKVILQIQVIKDTIDKITDTQVKDFFMVAFSETIRIVSNKRNGEFKMYRMEKKKLSDFNPNVQNVFFTIANQNIEKMNEFNFRLSNNESSVVESIFDDARVLDNIPDNSVDLIVTSPPYGDSRTTVAYGEFSKLSLQWIGLNNHRLNITRIDKRLLGGKNFSNGFEFHLISPTLEQALNVISEQDIKRSGDVFSFYSDLNLCLNKCSKKSKKDTYQFWVVGNRTVKGVYLRTDQILVELAKEHQLHHVTTFTRNIHNKVMPALNSPSNEKGKTVPTITNEFIVVLRKI